MYNDCVKLWRNGDIKNLMDNFFLKFSYSSIKIENNETRLRDVENVFKSESIKELKGDKKVLKEIENHKKLCNQIFQLTKENKPLLSIEIVKKFHKILMNGCFREELLRKGEKPGEFKKGDYVVGLFDVGANPEDVETELTSLIDEINEVEITEKNALTVVSYFHCWFESIHPFADGNGRVGRMLVNYLLIGNNLPPIILYQLDRTEYYQALEVFNDTQEIDLMVDFLDKQAYKTWEKNYNKRFKCLLDYFV